MTTQLKKISVKTVYGDISLRELIALHDQGKTLAIMRVIGCAVGSKTGTSQYGEWTALVGQFEAQNLVTGEQFAGSSLFLPDIALVPIQVALAGGDTRGVEFAIDVKARYVEGAKPGSQPYEYTFDALLPPDAGDPVSRLKAKLLALAPPPEMEDSAPKSSAADKAPAKKTAKGK